KQPFAAAANLGPGVSISETSGNRSGAVGAYSGPYAKAGLALGNESANPGTPFPPDGAASNSGHSPNGMAATPGGTMGGFGGAGNSGGSPPGNLESFVGSGGAASDSPQSGQRNV